MIKLAFVIDRILDCESGTEQQLVKFINSIDKTKFEIFLCCLRDSDFLKKIDFCHVYVCSANSILSFDGIKSALFFVNFLKKNNIDILQTFFKDGNFYGVLCANLANIPIIISSRRGEPYWTNFFNRFPVNFVNSFTDYFFVNSFFVKKLLVEKEGVRPSRIDVITNSMETLRIDQGLAVPREECRQRLGVMNEDFVVGIVAGLRQVKRHDLFIQAASLLCANGRGWRFLIVGDGPQGRQLREMVQAMGMNHAFSFLGSRQDVPEIVRAFDVGVLCSDFESTSNALLEYLALAVPVVCTQVGDNALYVEEGGNGFVVQPNDPRELADRIRWVREGKIDAQCLQAKAEFVVENFNAYHVHYRYQEKYMELYRDTRR